MIRTYREDFRRELLEKRKDIARVESLLDYIDELEQKVRSLTARIEIIMEARSEDGSSDMDEQQ